jgi:hypothetical protein
MMNEVITWFLAEVWFYGVWGSGGHDIHEIRTTTLKHGAYLDEQWWVYIRFISVRLVFIDK